MGFDHGVNDRHPEAGEPGAPAEPVEEPLPPLHQEAFDAISKGDYAGAVAAYRKAVELAAGR